MANLRRVLKLVLEDLKDEKISKKSAINRLSAD